MEEVLISRMVTLLQQPGLMPDDLEQDRQRLLNLLTAIQPVLGDAQLRARSDYDLWLVRNVGDLGVRTWLMNLKEVAYHADDILDGFRYVNLRAEAEATGGCYLNGENVSTGLFSCSIISRIKLPFFKRRMSGGEQGVSNMICSVVDRIRVLVERMSNFNFQESQGIIEDVESQHQLIFSSPIKMNPSVGRDQEKEDIVRFLLGSVNTVTESIVGILILGAGEIGKGTLARYVCEDARINDYFECIMWIDIVSEFTTIGKIAKSIIEQAIGKDCCLSEDDTDLLKHRINQELSGKRYLLVYNVVDGDEKLLMELKSWLEPGGGSGTSLIVLTEQYEFAENMYFTRVYHLQALMDDDLWILFCKSAFSDSNETCHEIIEMGRKIVHICEGSLLSVNLMGGLMRFKKQPGEWQEVLNQLQNMDGDVFKDYSIIMLCYNYMCSETKQCFMFCSLFPFGNLMEKEVLIKLWMANGLFSSDKSTSMEEKGDIVFTELVLRHFFTDVKLVQGESDLRVKKQEYQSRVVCKMPFLIYEFCKVVASNENIYHVSERHEYLGLQRNSEVFYLSMGGDSSIDLNMLLEHHPLMRTFVSTGDPFLRTVKFSGLPLSNSFRALHLRSSLFEGNLLEVVEHMKHLRYLDLSGSRIKMLPESTCTLYNLQTLNLSKCLLLYQLPENMRYIRSLRHLYLHKCPKLKRMPSHLGNLINLQTLSAYIVGERTGNGIDEIRNLNLGDLLELYNLRKVNNAEEARNANLVSKTNLEMLALCWGSHHLVMSSKSNDLEILEALKPHHGLKVLKVQQYGAPTFAPWLTNPVGLQNLVGLHLIGCSQCYALPAVWRLSSLQVLSLKHMASLTCICSYAGVEIEDGSELFPSLKKLVLVDLKRLERWHQEILKFPLLGEMEITNCPNLKTTPEVPNLKQFTGSIENHMQLLSVMTLIANSTSLVEANITKESRDDNDPFLLFWADVTWHDNCALRIMRLDSTDTFFMPRVWSHSLLNFWRLLIALENLDICNCNILVDWPMEELRSLNKLKRLSFRMCQNLTGVITRQLLEGEVVLPRLQTLEFYRCVSLKEVPKCCSILNLEVDECPKVESISGIINLEMLYLSCTSWMFLPTGLGDLRKLESLRVSECYSLARLPDELAGLTSLRTLIVTKCPRVKSLPDGLNQMLSGLEKFQTLECPDLERSCREGPYSSIITQIGIEREYSAGLSTVVEGTYPVSLCYAIEVSDP